MYSRQKLKVVPVAPEPRPKVTVAVELGPVGRCRRWSQDEECTLARIDMHLRLMKEVLTNSQKSGKVVVEF